MPKQFYNRPQSKLTWDQNYDNNLELEVEHAHPKNLGFFGRGRRETKSCVIYYETILENNENLTLEEIVGVKIAIDEDKERLAAASCCTIS